MEEQLRDWHPNPGEVAAIVRELRPLIAEIARRDSKALAALDRQQHEVLSRTG
jgi:hypothetical protein